MRLTLPLHGNHNQLSPEKVRLPRESVSTNCETQLMIMEQLRAPLL
jgi:hypothetical protein